MKGKGKLGPLSVISVVRELRRRGGDPRPLSVAGARELVPILARELRADGEASAVVENVLENVSALVWVGPPEAEQLHTADRAGVPIVAVSDADVVPYVLATSIVRIPPGLPVVRGAVCDHLIAAFAKRNAVIAGAVFIPGVDMPLLTLNQARLVLRIALAHGQTIDNQRTLELLGVVGAGFGFRAVARELLDFVPVAGWAMKAAIAYAGTKAVGEAAVRYFASR